LNESHSRHAFLRHFCQVKEGEKRKEEEKTREDEVENIENVDEQIDGWVINSRKTRQGRQEREKREQIREGSEKERT